MKDNSAHGYSEGSEEEEAQRMSKQLVQNIDKQIQKIKVNAANLEHITKSGEINGSLFMDIKNLILEKEIELKRKDEEIANHIAVNSLLLDSSEEAKLANHIHELQNALQYKDEEIQQLREFLKHMVDNSNFPGCNYTIPTEWRNKMIKIIASHRSKESCPNCLSEQIIMFNADLNLCNNCGQTF